MFRRKICVYPGRRIRFRIRSVFLCPILRTVSFDLGRDERMDLINKEPIRYPLNRQEKPSDFFPDFANKFS